MSCGQDCKCGSQSKPCRNKVICSRKVDKMLDLLSIFIQISWKRCKFAIFGEKTFVVLAKEMCCNPHDLSCRIIMRSCTVLKYFWINAHRLFFLVWQYTLSVYILVSHFSSTNVVIILNKNIHYCLFSWYFTSLWQDCIQTWDEPMVHKLCVRSLQCGLGSMDYIHSLLIMDDDNDSDTESEHFDVYRETPQESESTDSQHASAVAGPAPNPSAASNSLPWCKCSFCIVVVREDVLQHLQGSASFVSTQMC